MASIDERMQQYRESSGHAMTASTSDEPSDEEVRRLSADISRRDQERRRTEYQAAAAKGLKDVGTAVSVAPYDIGAGDLIYAGGELLDPEGDVGKAVIAAGLGVATGGLGSGALGVRIVDKYRDIDRMKRAQESLGKKVREDLEKVIPAPAPKQGLLDRITEIAKDVGYSLGPANPLAVPLETGNQPAAEPRKSVQQEGADPDKDEDEDEDEK